MTTDGVLAADITEYKKVKANIEANHNNYVVFTDETMNQLAAGIAELNKSWGYTLDTCGEKIDLDKYGIQHNHCVEDELIARIAYDDSVLITN